MAGEVARLLATLETEPLGLQLHELGFEVVLLLEQAVQLLVGQLRLGCPAQTALRVADAFPQTPQHQRDAERGESRQGQQQGGLGLGQGIQSRGEGGRLFHSLSSSADPSDWVIRIQRTTGSPTVGR